MKEEVEKRYEYVHKRKSGDSLGDETYIRSKGYTIDRCKRGQ
jgi:hypothetical protein